MNKFRLKLTTENQKSLEKGKRFAEMIVETLNCENRYKISKYEKFENSYQIEIIGEIEKGENFIQKSIELTDRICSPWVVTYQRTENLVELIFNKSDLSCFRKNEFNVLNWAQFEVENK